MTSRAKTPLPLRLMPVLRLALALLFLAIAALLLVVVPAIAWHDHHSHHYSTWGTIAGLGFAAIVILLLACVDVVIVCTWKLLTLVQRDEIFSAASDAWVTGIVRTVGAGWLLLAATAPYFYWLAESDDAPGVMLVGFVLGLIATAALLLMLVLRELLRRATALRADLDEVI